MDELAAHEASPIAGLVEQLAERIQVDEASVHPWPSTATPAQVLRLLMEARGMKQADLTDIGSQGVVSEILSGKRDLNVRQIVTTQPRLFADALALIRPTKTSSPRRSDKAPAASDRPGSQSCAE